MHTSIKVIVVLIILLIAAVMLVGMMAGWTGQSGDIMKDIFGFLDRMMPK